jgi:hypothetical protein
VDMWLFSRVTLIGTRAYHVAHFYTYSCYDCYAFGFVLSNDFVAPSPATQHVLLASYPVPVGVF